MLACCVLIVVVVVVVEQESLRLGVVFRNWFFVWFFVCFVFRVFWGFCGWVLEALCSPAQMRTQDGPAFRGSQNFGGFVYVLDRFPQRDFGLWVSMCPINIFPF